MRLQSEQIGLAFGLYLGNYNEYYPKACACEYGFYWSNTLHTEMTERHCTLRENALYLVSQRRVSPEDEQLYRFLRQWK